MNSIDISKQKESFKKHLDQVDNKRVFFSGLFGSGKTYFLKKFFNEYNKEYYCIHLYPINYQVASNEDIFEFIRYDILLQILGDHQFDSILNKDKLKNIALTLGKESIEKLIKLARFDPRVDTLTKAVKKIKELYDSVQNQGVEAEIENFLEYIISKPGIYQKNNIDAIIFDLLGSLKLPSVLVLDDLDRVDPAHLFRLLNVFAAHQDVDEQMNKFGFTKVILVGDYYNTKNIFHAIYGVNTDFVGYIDKFYSKEVFNFENRDNLAKTILHYTQQEQSIMHVLIFFVFLHLISISKFSTRNFVHFRSVAESLKGVQRIELETLRDFLLRVFSKEDLISHFKKINESNFFFVDENLGGYGCEKLLIRILDMIAVQNKTEYIYKNLDLNGKQVVIDTREIIEKGQVFSRRRSISSSTYQIKNYSEIWTILGNLL